MSSPLSALGAALRRNDPDRFLTALFAPTAQRETLFLLYAVNHELARARVVASEPALALIRLQWWREVVEGARRRHEVAGPLGEALDSGAIAPDELLEMIGGREREADVAILTRADWLTYLSETAGALAVAAGRILGAEPASLTRLRDLGMAYGLAGQLHSVTVLARQGRCLLPLDVLGGHGLTAETVIARSDGPQLLRAIRDLASDGLDCLALGRGVLPRAVLAAGLTGVLARRDLARIGRVVHPRGLGDRLAVIRAGLTGRI
jgi:15-cis-phytoene synthase